MMHDDKNSMYTGLFYINLMKKQEKKKLQKKRVNIIVYNPETIIIFTLFYPRDINYILFIIFYMIFIHILCLTKSNFFFFFFCEEKICD